MVCVEVEGEHGVVCPIQQRENLLAAPINPSTVQGRVLEKNKSLTYVTTSSVVNVHQKSDRLIYQLGLLTNNRLLFDLDQVWDIQGFGSAFFLRIRIRAKIFMRILIRIRILGVIRGRGLGVKGKNDFF